MIVMLPGINCNLTTKKECKVSYSKILRWISLWFFMSTTHFDNRQDFWDIKTISTFIGVPYRLNDFMSRTRFENILSNLCFTDSEPPALRDRFWEVRDLLETWNDNMTKNFIASWGSCLDESMSKWVNKYTCPGHMAVPRKP